MILRLAQIDRGEKVSGTNPKTGILRVGQFK